MNSQVKWLVPHTMTVMELARLLKQRLKVAPSIDILLMVRHFSDWEKTGKADWRETSHLALDFENAFMDKIAPIEPEFLNHQVNGDTMPALLMQMSELHSKFADPDGFLYFNFFSQETFG